jgi:hypothetical protein
MGKNERQEFFHRSGLLVPLEKDKVVLNAKGKIVAVFWFKGYKDVTRMYVNEEGNLWFKQEVK